jgi:hypothetical protein
LASAHLASVSRSRANERLSRGSSASSTIACLTRSLLSATGGFPPLPQGHSGDDESRSPSTTANLHAAPAAPLRLVLRVDGLLIALDPR